MSEAPAAPDVKQECDESPTLANLGAALALAQGQMLPAVKDKSNPHLGIKYADLASVWASCRKPLSDNGLAVLQRVRSAKGGFMLTTTLLHSSGEWMRDRIYVPVVSGDPKDAGAALTYFRRYALEALVGIATAEEDIQAANAARASSYAKAKAAKEAKEAERLAREQSQQRGIGQEVAQSKERTERVKLIWETARNFMSDAQIVAWTERVLSAKKNNRVWTPEDMGKLEDGLVALATEKKQAETANELPAHPAPMLGGQKTAPAV